MARPRKNTEEIIPLINKYWIERCDKNPLRLKYSMIAAYFAEMGFNIKEYDLRRNVAIVNYIKSLKDGDHSEICSDNTEIVFSSLDIDAFLNRNNDIYRLRKALADRDAYYSDICDFAIEVKKQTEQVKAEVKILKHINDTDKENITELCNNQNRILKENHEMKKKLTSMIQILKVHVYPEIANELLRDNQILSGGERIISPEGIEHIIKDQDSIITAIKLHEKNKSDTSVLHQLFDKI